MRFLRTARKTGSVSSAPPEELASSPPVWRPAAAPFALLRNTRKAGTVSSAPPEESPGSSPVWRPAGGPFALLKTAALGLLWAGGSLAAPAGAGGGAIGPLLGANLSTGPNGPTISAPMQIVIMLTFLALLPAVVMCVTPFLRISIVLHFLRQALGTQTAPSNQVLVGLALFLSILIMQPVAKDIYQNAWQPFDKGTMTMDAAFTQGSQPMRRFLLKFAREKDIQLFVNISRAPAPRTPQDLDLQILIPAYITSELKASFQIGTVLFLPFMVIDVVIASITVSMGMMQLPPVMLSAPFKILLFVLVDGWDLVIGSLMKGLYK